MTRRAGIAAFVLVLAALSPVVALTTSTGTASKVTKVTSPRSPRAVVATPPAFHVISSPDGARSRNVCSDDVQPGYAHCDALIRVDARARHDFPRPGNVASPSTMVGYWGAYSPAYLQSAYNQPALAAANGGGSGQIVAVVVAYSDPNLASDLAAYRSYFGLSACPTGTVSSSQTGCVFEQVNESGATSPLPSPSQSWGTEMSLDVEMVSALCPNCQILVVEANSASNTDLGRSVNTAVSLGADVVSNSYGGSEYARETTNAASYYNHPGVAIVASSGDDGYGVEYPAAASTVVAVGGTTLVQNTDTGTRNGSETVWNDSSGASGAGCSAYEPKPSWQHDTGCTNRTVADVAADADPSTGVWVYDSYGTDCTSISSQPSFCIEGGTSVSAPLVAAIFALAGNSLGSSNYPASYLYAHPNSLLPVTSGNDGTCSASAAYLCNAAQSQNGYNGPTGLGTPGVSPSSVVAFGSSLSPGTPTSVSLAPGDEQITASWTAPTSSGASAITGYTVTATNGSNSVTCTTTLTSCVVTGLTNGLSYVVSVVATNSLGSSAPSTSSAIPFTVPDPPSLTNVVSGVNSLTVSWTAPAFNGGSAITGYTATATNGAATYFCTTSTTSCTITGLAYNNSYSVSVVANNAAGSSASSNSGSSTPFTSPGAPTNVSAVAGNASASVSWTAPSSTGGTSITGYSVSATDSSVSPPVTITNVCASSSTSTSTSCLATGLTNGDSYTFSVVALNPANGPSSASSNTVVPYTNPAAPTITSLVAGNQGLTVSWRAPAANGSTIIGYTASATSGLGTSSCSPATTSLTSCVITGLTNGVNYSVSVSVTATNASGTVTATSPPQSATPETLPSAPTNVSVNDASNVVTLSWSAPITTGGSPLSGYSVEAVDQTTSSTTPVCPSAMASTSTSCVVTGLTPGDTYLFDVAAVNGVGTGPFASSTTLTPATIPGAPAITSLTPGNGSLTVYWNAPSSSGGSAISGYVATATTGSQNATCTSSTTSCVISGLVNGASYAVSVAAVNAVGSSASSASLSATPATTPGAPTALSVRVTLGMAALSWKAPRSNGGASVTSYTVSLGNKAVCVTSATTCAVANLMPNKRYAVTVTATNAQGSGASASLSFVTPKVAPDAIAVALVQSRATSLTIDVIGATSVNGANVTGYLVSTSGGRVWRTYATTHAVSTLTISGLRSNTRYQVLARSFSASGQSKNSNTLFVTTSR